MRYIAYYTVEPITGINAVKLCYTAIPYSEAALRELENIGAEILHTNMRSTEDCRFRTNSHSLALDAKEYYANCCLN